MAKAAFEKGQRVFVRPVGCYAVVEKVIPHWVKGMDEPFKIHYDVGLGREFAPSELTAPKTPKPTPGVAQWRLARAQAAGLVVTEGETTTVPVILTQRENWGGWTVSAAEFQAEPARVEAEAELISAAPDLLAAAKGLLRWAEGANLTPELQPLVRELDAAVGKAMGVAPAEPTSTALAYSPGLNTGT
jgi:hypothetical protein